MASEQGVYSKLYAYIWALLHCFELVNIQIYIK